MVFMMSLKSKLYSFNTVKSLEKGLYIEKILMSKQFLLQVCFLNLSFVRVLFITKSYPTQFYLHLTNTAFFPQVTRLLEGYTTSMCTWRTRKWSWKCFQVLEYGCEYACIVCEMKRKKDQNLKKLTCCSSLQLRNLHRSRSFRRRFAWSNYNKALTG